VCGGGGCIGLVFLGEAGRQWLICQASRESSLVLSLRCNMFVFEKERERKRERRERERESERKREREKERKRVRENMQFPQH
jgi:hypothetical protein